MRKTGDILCIGKAATSGEYLRQSDLRGTSKILPLALTSTSKLGLQLWR
jgi:hypothetical protein